ncbi:MAG: hypothetical protein A3I66_19840 [Burkholderiales bacterium RIFCSPLOWO2_02_FULL_57_36]|nr:MAG: hypothetical protein A3I66_19840 [Burkholderiales bacterium RIFCSPLOWO2_02_FULL_57_36]
MDSRRPNRSCLCKPLHPILSGKAAFSSKNGLVFLKQYSDAGVFAGVLLATDAALLQSKGSQ